MHAIRVSAACPGSSPGPPITREDASGPHVLAARREGERVVSRDLLSLTVTVKDGERALLLRNGRLDRVLAPGRHRFVDPLRALSAEVLAVVRTEFPAERYAVLKAER